ncbi:translation initiation factor IF-2-like [Amphibalanus amphitrite]|uniref:translation initiation factor IF-2-like n=1 Tax=Amphibalanus amphitrite TaxID=1232801 RepID=UPI001C900F5F|nr:translation initiation factor IF-2-like [Amphibalanus amphitrite]
MKKILIQELTALLERQAERAAEADKRLERLERLLYREPSAGTGTGTTAGVVRDSETGAVSRMENSEPTLRHAVTVGETWSAHVTCQDLCGTKGHFVAHLSAYKRDRSRPSVAHAAAATNRQFLERCPTCGRRQHDGGDTCRAAGAICRACGERGHFDVVCHQRATATADRPVAPSAVTTVCDSPGVALVAVAAGTAVSPPPADTGQAGHTALQSTELSDAADVHGASPPPAGGWPTQTTDSNEAPDNAVSPPPADTGRIGCAAAQPTEPDGATDAYGASPPPAGGIPTCSTDGVGQSTRPAAAYGASPPPAGGLPTRTRDGGTAAGYAVSPLPGDTSQADCCAAQPTELSKTTDVYGASPPPAGGMPTRSTDGGPAASTAKSPPPAGTGQAGCSHAAQPTQLADAYGASPPLAGGLPVRSGDGDPPEQMGATHAAALLRTPQGCVSAGDKSNRRGDTNLGDTTLHSVEVVDELSDRR